MSDDKIIRGFSERLALDRAVRALADAPTAFELEKRARALAQQGKVVLKPMLRHLDTPDAQMRGGLGLVAQRMDPMLIVPALRRVVADGRRTDDARLTAAMLLERYLDVTLDPALAQTLPDTSTVARQSAEEALALAETEPLVMVEYAEQLLEESDEVIATVIDVLLGMDDPRRASLLMVIASYAGTAVVARILPTLGTIRHPHSLHSLITLSHLVDPALRPAVERQARKLQLAGVRSETSTSPRVLWSPINAQGQSLMWAIRYHSSTERTDYLALILHDDLGVIHAEARPQMDPADLPMPAPVGHVHDIHTPGSHYVLRMVEIDPKQGRALVDTAASRLRENDIPWPGELVVFGHWLWGEMISARSAPEWPALPSPTSSAGPVDFQNLLKHRGFASWAWDLPDLQQLLHSDDVTHALEKDSPAHQAISQRLVTSESDIIVRRLEQQALWLTLANDTDSAALVLAARDAILAGQADHPFVQALAWRSLLTAAADQATRRTLRLIPHSTGRS
jgi:hypothetical protein